MHSRHLPGGDVGEKSEMAKVDADQRYVVYCERARGIEQGAVAADDYREIAAPADLIAAGGLDADIREQHRGIRIQQHSDALCAEVDREGADRVSNACVAELANDADVLESHCFGSILDKECRKGITRPVDHQGAFLTRWNRVATFPSTSAAVCR